MRIRSMLAGIAVAGMMAVPAAAQEGQYREPLARILEDTARGTCPAALMAEALLNACNGQIQAMAPALAAMGAVESMTFVSATDTPEGRVETWRVKHVGGPTLTWNIGQRQGDGKFRTVGTAG